MKIQSFSNRESVIWAAGLFEGEGWISIQGYCPSMGIQMSDKDILEKFAQAIGGGPIYYRKPKVYSYEVVKTRKEQWAWRVVGFQNVQAVIAYLWPWLGARRRSRAKEVLQLAQLGQIHGGTLQGQKTSKAEHGTVRKFWTGCKCDPCKQANRDYTKRNNAKTKDARAARSRHPKEVHL